MIDLKARKIIIAAMAVAMLLACLGMIPRLRTEQSNKTAAFAMEYRDLMTLSLQTGSSAEKIWKEINKLG